MMAQDEFMDVVRMHAEGMTFSEIAEATGYHGTTIADWIKAGGPPPKRRPAALREVVTGHRRQRGRGPGPGASGPVVDVALTYWSPRGRRLVSHPVRALRGPRFKAAKSVSMPIEAALGAEAQFDFADVSDAAATWGWRGGCSASG